MPRYFRLEQAERLLPELEGLMREARELEARYRQADSEWRESSGRLLMLGGVMPDRRKLLAQRGRRDALEARLGELVQAIQSRGCLVKDLELGLVDFPTLLRGEEVLLCWRLGEPSIAYWHGLEEGYRGRKPIDEEFRRLHRGDQPS